MNLVRLSHQGKVTTYSTQLSERERQLLLYALCSATNRKAPFSPANGELENLIREMEVPEP